MPSALTTIDSGSKVIVTAKQWKPDLASYPQIARTQIEIEPYDQANQLDN
jgi:hypothetical protein